LTYYIVSFFSRFPAAYGLWADSSYFYWFCESLFNQKFHQLDRISKLMLVLVSGAVMAVAVLAGVASAESSIRDEIISSYADLIAAHPDLRNHFERLEIHSISYSFDNWQCTSLTIQVCGRRASAVSF
jgi:hypothetical protein